MQGGFTDALMRNHHFSTSFSRNTFRSIYSKWCIRAYQITRLWITALNTTDYYINKNRNKYVFSNITEYLLKLGNKK